MFQEQRSQTGKVTQERRKVESEQETGRASSHGTLGSISTSTETKLVSVYLAPQHWEVKAGENQFKVILCSRLALDLGDPVSKLRLGIKL